MRDTRALLKKLGTGVRDADKVELPCPPFLERKVIKVRPPPRLPRHHPPLLHLLQRSQQACCSAVGACLSLSVFSLRLVHIVALPHAARVGAAPGLCSRPEHAGGSGAGAHAAHASAPGAQAILQVSPTDSRTGNNSKQPPRPAWCPAFHGGQSGWARWRYSHCPAAPALCLPAQARGPQVVRARKQQRREE